jgi:hypothetical protein
MILQHNLAAMTAVRYYGINSKRLRRLTEKVQILMQASQAIIAQANHNQNGVLALLRF